MMFSIQGHSCRNCRICDGKGTYPSCDGEIWGVRRRVIVPILHQKYVAVMISLFGQATDRLCQKLDEADSNKEDVEMESLFSC
ncbi:protein LUTEIN DEFICIENT 5, chloroplastic-like [Rhododendron vialii]|uniref:protein LUTEIN DEFICIENT 5, chloroplastic-like n=1 Tax=Rhododendron vialii TaxID=182163 RepID=UPI0026605350|nr:protein LUTEIN DEFICIENT 5, chloroplastic-like [Rhododendron vialii]